jgi:CRP-like cAMP-binding protein
VAKEVVFDEIDRDPKFARRMIAGLSRRLHHLVSDVEAYTLRSATQRVIGYLLRPQHEEDEAEKSAAITLPASKSVIASRLNITPEHFSRILHELSNARLIQVDGRTVNILNVERLQTYEG